MQMLMGVVNKKGVCMEWLNSEWASIIFAIIVYGVPGAAIVYTIFQVGRYFKKKADKI